MNNNLDVYNAIKEELQRERGTLEDKRKPGIKREGRKVTDFRRLRTLLYDNCTFRLL